MAPTLSGTIKVIKRRLAGLSKRRDDIFVYGAWFGNRYGDNPRYFFEYMVKNHPEIRSVWITKNPDVISEVQKAGGECCMADSAEGIRAMKKAKYVFTCTGRDDTSDVYTANAVNINFWHGIPLKKIMYDDDITFTRNANYDRDIYLMYGHTLDKEYVISTSKVITDIYHHAFNKDDSHVVMCGQPRNDYFYNADNDGIFRSDYPGRYIITYMPTHRKEGRAKMDIGKIMDLDKLNKLLKESNALFVIKKHYYHAKEPKVTGYSNIIDITDQPVDAQDMMLSTDLLITDYSSVYIDYLLLNRPMIFYSYDISDYLKNDRGMYFEYEKVTPGPVAEDFDSLYESIRKILIDKNDEFEAVRSEVTDIFYDKSARRMVSPVIYEMIQKGRFR